MQKEKIIMYESAEAARPVTMFSEGREISRGFLSVDNFFFNDEDMARYRSHTHRICECGNIMKRGWTKCEVCIAAMRREAYFKLPLQNWDGDSYVVEYNGDRYFRNASEVEEYCEEHEVNAQDLMLVLCEPNNLWEVTPEYWQDIEPEGSEGDFLPKEVEECLKKLNEVISKSAPVSYGPGKIRITHLYTPDSLKNQGENPERRVATDTQSE